MFNCPLVDEEEGKKQVQSRKIIKFKDSEAKGVFILPLWGDQSLSPQTLERDKEQNF